MPSPQDDCKQRAQQTLNNALRLANNIPSKAGSAVATTTAWAIYLAAVTRCTRLPK
jgi:hypothetical protein